MKMTIVYIMIVDITRILHDFGGVATENGSTANSKGRILQSPADCSYISFLLNFCCHGIVMD